MWRFEDSFPEPVLRLSTYDSALTLCVVLPAAERAVANLVLWNCTGRQKHLRQQSTGVQCLLPHLGFLLDLPSLWYIVYVCKMVLKIMSASLDCCQGWIC